MSTDAQSDSELTSHHPSEVSLDRGYTSDSEIYTEHSKTRISRSTTDVDVASSGWLVVSIYTHVHVYTCTHTYSITEHRGQLHFSHMSTVSCRSQFSLLTFKKYIILGLFVLVSKSKYSDDLRL